MMSRHFALSSELSGAIVKRLPHAKNQLSAPSSFFNQFVTEIYIYVYIYYYKRASLACAARLADTMCPPEAPFGRLEVTLVNYNGDNISEYVCPTVLINFTRKVTKFVNFKIFDE